MISWAGLFALVLAILGGLTGIVDPSALGAALLELAAVLALFALVCAAEAFG